MLTTFKPLLLALASGLFLISCQKEINDDSVFQHPGQPGTGHSSGTAVFKLLGAPNTCANYTVQGNYTVGIPVDATNKAHVDVNVISAGTFEIATAATNGITFSANGTFDAPGVQSLELNATGTPSTAGTFTYRPGSEYCSFPVSVSSAAPQIAAGTLDCTQAWSEGNFISQVAMTDSNKLFIPVTVTTVGTYSVQTDVVNGTTFSGTGNLDAGSQIIEIKGNGTPLAAGSYLLTVSLGASECSFYITFQ